MADLNVVSNPEFFMLFRTRSYIFRAKNTNECAIFYWLSSCRYKTEASFNEEAFSIKYEEKPFKTLYNFIVRNCEFFWCTERELSLFS